jgi:hypothetical protein
MRPQAEGGKKVRPKDVVSPSQVLPVRSTRGHGALLGWPWTHEASAFDKNGPMR